MTTTMQSGYDFKHLLQEAQVRWLKPVEVLFILQNHEEHQISHKVPHMPTSGSVHLFNKRVLKYFRKDGHSWRRRRDQRSTAEAHERLKVGNIEVLNCYYAHGLQNSKFQRRSYWILDPAYEHIVLVHYRDIGEGAQNPRLTSPSSTLSSSTHNLSPTPFATPQPDTSFVIGECNEPNHCQPSPGSVLSSNEVIEFNGINPSDIIETTKEIDCSSGPHLSEALRRIEQQLCLNDDGEKEFNTVHNGGSVYLQNGLLDYDLSAQALDHSENLLSQWQSGDRIEHSHQLAGPEVDTWEEMFGSSNSLSDVETQAKYGHKLNENQDMLLNPSPNEPVREQDSYNWLNFDGRSCIPESSTIFSPEVDSIEFPSHSPLVNLDSFPTFFDQAQIGIPLEEDVSLTISQKQKFTIREISPEWCYSFDPAKVVIIGSFLCNPSECSWACMFGDIEVPVQIIQEGVIRCSIPPRLPGKVTLCITSGNRESCSEVREFEYRAKPSDYTHSSIAETETSKSSEELSLLVQFAQILLSDPSAQKGNGPESRTDSLSKSKMAQDSWSQIAGAPLVGTLTSSNTMEWLLQELLKDKLEQWLSSRLRRENNNCTFNEMDTPLSKKEQGIIHMVAGLGFEWALQPILNSGVGVNFRDTNGWTALHWAAHFGRETMVAALIACGASAGAVTDPKSQDPTGKTPASIASERGHKGLAGYLSEMALTGHLSSLTLEESELSKGSASVEAERTVNSISNTSNEDQDSMKCTLAAVRNAAQAAARIQDAFRAHSFRKRKERVALAAIAASACKDENHILSDVVHGFLAAREFGHRSARDYNSAALSIQKKYRGWKWRQNFLSLRQKVVKIQAHVRGYQVRKYYKVCWAVSILEKVVLRWRRGGAGLRGFQVDTELIEESENEDILKVFRKQKVDAALKEAVSRVLSMVESSEARQQYRRIFEKYLQAKAELETPGSQASGGDNSQMENDNGYQLT